MALLSSRGISTPSLPAQGEQRRSSIFNIPRDIPQGLSEVASLATTLCESAPSLNRSETEQKSRYLKQRF
jgi:hypothetical protein